MQDRNSAPTKREDEVGWRIVRAPTTVDAVAKLERDLAPGWALEAEVQLNRDKRLIFRSLTVRPSATVSTPPSGITSLVWRAVNIGQLLDSARDVYADLWEWDAQTDWAISLASDWTRPGSQGHPDELYARLAYAYAHLVERGVRTPVQELASENWMSCSRATANTRIAEARRRGLLTPPASGRSGGRLTAKARRLLGFPIEDGDCDGERS